MIDRLSRPERLQLMRYVVSFAWADQELHPSERRVVKRFLELLELDESERSEVEAWLSAPPDPVAVDAAALSQEQRVVYTQAIQAVIMADGTISPEERSLFQEMLP